MHRLKETIIIDQRTCLVRVSLTKDCSCEAKRLLTSFNSAAMETTFLLKLCFFSFKSFNRGSISLAEAEDDVDMDGQKNLDPSSVGRFEI